MPPVVKSEAFSYICTIMGTEWQRILRREASASHMCAENRGALEKVESRHDAIELYKKTIDWALESGYPSLGVLRQYFSDCGNEGVFIDRDFHGEILIDHQVYVFHNCTGTIRVGLNPVKKIIPMLYFANGCDMDVKGVSGALRPVRVPLYVFGPNRVGAEQSEDISCVTYKFDAK